MSVPPNLFEKFPDMTPITSPPSMHTMNGIGTMLYGRRDFDEETQTYVGTLWFTVFFIPILPVSAYRVADAGSGWYFIGRTRVGGKAKLWPIFLLSVVLAIVGLVAFNAHLGHPDTIAGKQLATAETEIEAGKLRAAAQRLQRLAEGNSKHASAAKQRLEQLVASPPEAPGTEIVGLFETAVACHQGRRLKDCYRDGVNHAHKLADSDPLLARQILAVVAKLPPVPPPDDVQGLQREVLEKALAKEPDNMEVVADYAELLEIRKEDKKLLELLMPHREKLGSTEGARVLGQMLVAGGKFEEAFPLLDEYAKARLPLLHKAEKENLDLILALQKQVISELNSGTAVGFDQAVYAKASKEKQAAMDSEYMRKRLLEDADYIRSQAKLAGLAKVVTVGLDLGIVRLRRGQAMEDPAKRRAELELAEKTFQSVRTSAGNSDEFRILMGQVYYWMGEHAKGRKHFDEFLRVNGNAPGKVLLVAGLLRQVGAATEARTLLEKAYETATDARAKESLARMRSVLLVDSDDEMLWLQRSGQDDPDVKAALAAAQGRKAMREGKEDEAVRLFRQTAEIYGALPLTSANLNNRALALLSLFQINNDKTVLKEAIGLMEKAHALRPDDTIGLQNLAEMLMTAVWMDLLGDQFDQKILKRSADARLAGFLYADAKGKAKMQERMKAHPNLANVRSYFDRLLVISPKSTRVYQTLADLHRYLNDAQGPCGSEQANPRRRSGSGGNQSATNGGVSGQERCQAGEGDGGAVRQAPRPIGGVSRPERRDPRRGSGGRRRFGNGQTSLG